MSTVQERVSELTAKLNSVGMSGTVFNSLPSNVKQGDKLTTLSYFRMCLQNGTNKGRINIGSVSGIRFEYQDVNVIVCQNSNRILAAYKSGDEDDDKQSITVTVKSNKKVIHIGKNAINLSKLELTDHYLERCKERFYITDTNLARRFMEDIVTEGEYIGITKAENNNGESHTFVRDGNVVFISTDGQRVISTYKKGRLDEEPRKFIKESIEKRINNLKRKYSSLHKEALKQSFSVRRELIDLEERLFKTRSEAVKNVCRQRIQVLTQEQIEMNQKLEELSRTINQHKKSLIPFV